MDPAHVPGCCRTVIGGSLDFFLYLPALLVLSPPDGSQVSFCGLCVAEKKPGYVYCLLSFWYIVSEVA